MTTSGRKVPWQQDVCKSRIFNQTAICRLQQDIRMHQSESQGSHQALKSSGAHVRLGVGAALGEARRDGDFGVAAPPQHIALLCREEIAGVQHAIIHFLCKHARNLSHTAQPTSDDGKGMGPKLCGNALFLLRIQHGR